LVGTGTDVQAVLEELDNGIADHLADTTDAHDASAVSFSAVGTIAGTDVQTAVAEVASDAATALSAHVTARATKVRQNTTAGIYTITGTSYVDVDAGLDLVIPAAAGDLIEVGLVCKPNPENARLFLDFASIVAGSPVTYWSGAGSTGEGAWTVHETIINAITGSIPRAAVSGDIAGGTITLRLRGRCMTATSRIIRADGTRPLTVYARNLGPAAA
jgi:hypothetical protein